MRGRKRHRKKPAYGHKATLWPLSREDRLRYLDACARGDTGGMLKGLYPMYRYGRNALDSLYTKSPFWDFFKKGTL